MLVDLGKTAGESSRWIPLRHSGVEVVGESRPRMMVAGMVRI
jgi:hypothetical protein